VALDGALAEVEPGGDLGVGQSLGYQPRDGEFAFGQAPGRGGWRGAGCRVAAEVLDQPPRDGGGQEGLVGGDRADGASELLVGGVLEQEAARAGRADQAREPLDVHPGSPPSPMPKARHRCRGGLRGEHFGQTAAL
jgi:hypothetical protein